MAQIIKHRRGSLESVSSATKRSGELLVVTGSAGITANNSNGLLFVGIDGSTVTAANKFLQGSSVPDLTGASYDTSIDGIPFYDTNTNKLYILNKGGNIEVQATANTNGTGIVSGSSQITIGNTTGFTTFSSSLASTNAAQNVRLSSLETFSSSLGDGFATDAELTAVSSAFDSTIDNLSTSDIAEGSNLYFTDARVKTKLNTEGVISGSSQVQIDSVTGFTAFSSSADSRLDTIEASLGEGGGIGGRVEDLEATSSNQEGRIELLEVTGSDHESRLDVIEGKTLVSSSAQIVTRLNNQNVNFGTGAVTASFFKGNGSQLTNIPLGTATTGNYVQNLVAGAGISLANNSGEGATPTIATVQDISDSASPTFSNLTLTGDLSVSGTTTTTNQTTLTVSDSKIFLADGNVSDAIDSAVIFNYATGGTPDTAGIFRDATDGSITFFGAYTGSDEIGNTIDITNPNFSLGTVKAGEFVGDLSWNNVTDRPDPTITLSMGGDVSANATVTLTDLGDATLHVTASIPADTDLTLNNLTIDGNLTVTGATTSTNVTTVSSENPLVILNSGSIGNPDVGIIGKYDDGGTDKVNGFFRDATDGKWKVFDGSTQNMGDSSLINIANAGYQLATLQAGTFEGNLDFSYLQNVPEPTITINAGGNLSGSAQTTLTNLGNGTLNLDLTIPTTSNLTLNSLDISTDLDVVGDISGDNIAGSGNLTVGGTASVTSNLTVGGNATITGDISADNLVLAGNLTVQGTTTTVNSTTIELGDNIIELNGSGATNGGLLVNDPNGPLSGSLLWDGTNNYWKAGGAGEESKVLLAGGDGVISGSSQVNADTITNFDSNVKDKMNNDGVISGSAQITSLPSVDTGDLSEGSNLYYTNARVKTKLNTEGVISSSLQVDIDTVSGFDSYSGSVDTRLDDLESAVGGGSNIDTRLTDLEATGSDHESRLDVIEGKTLVSSSAQVIEHLVGNDIVTNGITGTSLSISGNATIDGNLVLGGNISIGDASSDSITFGGEITSDIIPDPTNTYDLGSATNKFAEIHGTTIFGSISATNGVISGSSQLHDAFDVRYLNTNGDGVHSGSAQVVSALLNQATDFGTGRVSGDNFGDAAGTSTFTGSFVGDGSQLTGLVTDLRISGSTGNDVVSLLSDDLSIVGSTGITTAITDNTITISGVNASTSAKGVASFDADDFSVASGNVSIKSAGVRAANLNDDVAGTGISLNGVDNSIEVDYGSTSGTAVEGNTSLTVQGTTNEIEVTSGNVTLGAGGTVTIGLPDDVTVGNDLSVTNDLSVGGNVEITGNLSVLGTTTTVNSTTVELGDNIIELNGAGNANGGLLVKDVTAPNTVSGSLLWDSTNDFWKAGALGSEKELARLNSAPTANTILKANADGLLVDSVLSDDGTDATFSGDVIVDGFGSNANGAFLYADASNTLTAIAPSNAGDVIQWNGSSFVASNELDGGTF